MTTRPRTLGHAPVMRGRDRGSQLTGVPSALGKALAQSQQSVPTSCSLVTPLKLAPITRLCSFFSFKCVMYLLCVVIYLEWWFSTVLIFVSVYSTLQLFIFTERYCA